MIDVAIDSDRVATVRLGHGAVNALDLELATAVADTFRELGGDDVRAVVLTGNGRAFSAGVDLVRVLEEEPSYLDAFLPRLTAAFEAVWEVDLPVVAAVDGPAIAGGCIVACAADRRLVGEERGRIGVTELSVGVPFPLAALEILRSCVDSATAGELAITAEILDAGGAVAAGLADRAVPDAELVDLAVDDARRLADIPTESFAITKEQVRRPFARRVAHERRHDDQRVLDAWKSTWCRDAMARFAEQHLGWEPGDGAS